MERETRRRRRKLLFEHLETRRVLATVSGHIAYDFDADGQLEAIEPGLENWLIYVDDNNDLAFNYTDNNANQQFDDGIDDALEPYDLSGPDGSYSLTDLPAGPHAIAQVNQTGWQQTFPPGTGRHTVVVTADQDLLDINFANQRDFTPFAEGNILVNRSSFIDNDLLIEYTPDGQLVQALVVPGSEDDSQVIAKDLVLDGQGNVQIFDGYDDVRLTTFDPGTPGFADTEVTEWDIGRTFSHWGDIAAFGDFIFANEHIDTSGTADGVIRFNAADLSFERFSDGFGLPTDLTVGLDGLLYTLNATHNNTTVHIHDPVTMDLVRTFNIPERLHSVAVDVGGNLYAITDTVLKHFDSTGSFVKSTTGAGGDDIAISDDGKLLLASALRIDITDTDFASVSSFSLPGDGATNFLGFAAFVQDPVGHSQGPPGGEDFGVFTPGNILVSNSPLTTGDPKLFEYTPFGQLVQEFDIPAFEVGGARDLVMDSQANVQIYNGTFDPRLSTFDPHKIPTTDEVRGFLSHAEFEGWSTANNATFGGIAATGEFAFAADVRTNDDTAAQRGIVRYDIDAGTFERFHSQQGDIIDLNIGLDGLLYVLGPAGDPTGTTVHKYHPVTMELLAEITLPASHRAIAVDANGDIFAVDPDIYRYDNDGVLQGTPLDAKTIDGLADIDIDQDGRLLIAASDGHILMTDRHFTGLFTFLTRQSDGQNFAAFVSPSRGSLRANWDSFTIDEDSINNELNVLANDVLQGLGSLTITFIEQPQYGLVRTIGNTSVAYTPAGNYVGPDTFTYTISDGMGGSDQGFVTVTVEGTANFFAEDDRYSTFEDTELIIPASSGLLINDGQLDIFPVLTPGNILVTHSPVGVGTHALLQEYTTTGTLIRSIELPDFSEGDYADVRDVVLDFHGNVQIYNGTYDPRLTTYDPVTDALSNKQFPNWSSARNNTFGGLATWRNFVFATDQETPGDVPDLEEGIVRFDMETLRARRFVDDGDFIDLAVGLDGSLYALGPGSTPTGQYIRVYNPLDMALEREIQLPAGTQYENILAITVDAAGNIYAVRRNDPFVYVFDRDGNFLRWRNSGLGSEALFSDIDIHENGRDLLIANINFNNSSSPNDGDVILTTTALAWFNVLQAPDDSSDMKFASWVQPPVAALNGPLAVNSFTQPSHGAVDVLADGSFTYTPDPDFAGEDSFTYVVQNADGLQRGATVVIDVIPRNDPPVLTIAPPSDLSDEDQAYTIPLTAIINGGAGTTTITDVDKYDPLGGIAVTEVSGPGNWSYSTGGTIFVDVGEVSDDNALLLPFGAEVRFAPAGGAGGTATFTYRAWDTTMGVAGNKFDPTYFMCALGGVLVTATDPEADPQQWCEFGVPPNQTEYAPAELVHEAFSEDQDTLTLTLTDLNDAPVLVPQSPVMGFTDEHTPFEIAVDGFVVGVSDPDGGLGVEGIAVVGASGNGQWYYSLDGINYDPLPVVSDAAALIMDADDLLQYVPDGLNGEEASVTYRAWDKSDSSTAGDIVDVRSNGGATAFSATTDSGRLGVTDVNDAPVLAPASPFLGVTDVITPFEVMPDTFVTGISDIDRDATVGGIAITEAVGLGTWAYSTDGLNFTVMPVVSEFSALLLHGNDKLRYTPDALNPETATVTYRVWDATQGQAGATVDVTPGGDESAFSIADDTARLTVKEVNTPPVIGGPSAPVQYTENDQLTPIFFDVTVTDSTSPDLAGGMLSVAILNGGTPNDRLSVGTVGDIQVVGENVWFDGGSGPKLIGRFVVDGWNLDVNLVTQDTTAEAIQALARAISYENVSENPFGNDRLMWLTITDGDGGDDTSNGTQTVSVKPVNDPPTAASETYQVTSGNVLDVSFLEGVLTNDSDFEGDALIAVLDETTQNGELTFNSDGSFSYTPNVLFHGLDTFTYTANDGQADSAIITVAIEVLLPHTNPAHPADVSGDGYLSPLDPLLAANYVDRNGPGPVPQDQPPPFYDVNGDGLVTDADAQIAANVIDAQGARQIPPPRLEFPLDPPVLGFDEFVRIRLETTDASGNLLVSVPAGERFFLDVLVSDQRVVPQGVFAAYLDVTYDDTRVSSDGPISFGDDFPNFRTGDASTSGLIDEVGAGNTEPPSDGSEHLLFRMPFMAETRGEAFFAGDPADELPASQVLLFGIDGPIPEVNVTPMQTAIIVTGPPDAVDDAYQVAEDGVLEVLNALLDGVLANDTDDEGDTLTAVLDEGPAHGSLQLDLDGTFVYTPDEDFFGTDQFTYKANDGFFDSTPATVIITVTGVDDLPTAQDDRYGVLKDGTLTVAAGDGVLANDIDLDQDGLTVSLPSVQGPQHGNLQMDSDGSFIYTPDAGFGGVDRFTYQANDGIRDSNLAVVDIDVLYDWQNPTHPIDINGDGYASAIDPLLIFNEWERNGGDRLLPSPPVPPDAPPPFYDYNGDGVMSSFDGQAVLQELDNTGAGLLSEPRLDLPQDPPELPAGDLVNFRLETTDAAGNPQAEFGLGETFYLNVFVEDLRFLGDGVFSAYLDVAYPQAGLTTAGSLEYGAQFPNVQAGDIQTPGVLDEVGAVRPSTPGNGHEMLLFRAPFAGTAVGQHGILGDAADIFPISDTTLHGIDGPIPVTKIVYGSTAVTITVADGDGDGVTDREEDGAPHAGDGNNDTTSDKLQSNVASLASSVNGRYVTFAAPPQTAFQNVQAADNPSPGDTPSDVGFALGFFEFELGGLAAGGSAIVTTYLEAGATANTYYRYGPTPDNPAPHWYPFMFDGATGAKVYGDRIEIHFVDGARGDDDLTTNGVVAGPGGFGLVARPWQNPVLPEDVNNDGAVTPLDALLLIGSINTIGSRDLPLIPEGNDCIPPYWDVSGDGRITPVDVLLVIGFLNDLAGGGEGESVANGPAMLAQTSTVTSVEEPSRLLPGVGLLAADTVSPIMSSAPATSPTATPLGPFATEPVADQPVPRRSAFNQIGRPSSRYGPSTWLPADSDLESTLSDIAGEISDVWGQIAMPPSA